MPLKFATETLLLSLLGLVTILTGVLLATLPALPEGLVPGILLLAATLLYALSYTGLFRRDRAEYSLRLLHLFPAAIVLGWFVVEGLRIVDPQFSSLTRLYTWGWSVGPVILGFILLMLFCLSVIRLWGMRLLLLILLLVPFLALGFLSGTRYRWEERLAAMLWQGTWWNVTGTGGATLPGGRPIAYVPSSAPTPAEQAWSSAVAAVQGSSASSSSRPFADGWFTVPSSVPAIQGSSSSQAWYVTSQGTITNQPQGSSSSRASSVILPPVPDSTPPSTPKPLVPGKGNLAHSGPFTEIFAGLLLAGYTTAVHGRVRRRLRVK